MTKNETPTAENSGGPVVWEGAFLSRHSLALVNRELAMTIASMRPRLDLRIRTHVSDDLSLEYGPAHGFVKSRLCDSVPSARLWIRHHWPPNWERPEAARAVAIQPWEFGSLPKEWVRAIQSGAVDELWTPSSFVRDCCVQSGVDADRVFVAPNGVNTVRFHPQSPPIDLPTQKSCRFLFVGGTIARKGIDVLLDAYARAFTARDDVSLVIKDFGAGSFYAGQDAAALIAALQAKPGAPEIVHLTADIPESEMAGLYAACHCLVHPYRGEGFGLPIAEAMACGRPAIVTGFGAALDFANAANSYLIPAAIARFAEKRVGSMETVDYPWWAEPDRDALLELLRRVAANPSEAAERGARAALEIHSRHLWAHAAEVAAERIDALLSDSAARPRAAGESYESRKQQALAHTRAANWTAAKTACEACLSERPGDLDIVNALGVSLFRLGDTLRAGQVMEAGLAAARPESARDLHHNLAFLLLGTEQKPGIDEVRAALEHACRALELSLESDCNPADVRRTVERARECAVAHAKRLRRAAPDRRAAKSDPLLTGLNRAVDSADALLLQRPESSPRPLVSLVMIVKNEERFLRECLESAREAVDEIIVVDTGSTDGTLGIAREFGAKIVAHAWQDDFSAARNVSLEHARGDWALWLDADERLAKGGRSDLRKLLRETPGTTGGYMLNIRNFLQMKEDPEVCWHRACRLFRNLPSVRFTGRIHEQNARPLREAGFNLVVSDLVIDHYGYAHEVMDERDKHARFIRMLTREVEENQDDTYRTFHLFNLANAHYTRGDMASANRWFEKADENPDPAEEYTAMLYAEWATALYTLGRAEDSLRACERAEGLGIEQASIAFAKAHALLHLRRYEEAECSFVRAIELGKSSHVETVGDSGARSYKARYGLALAAMGRERFDEAVRWCRDTLDERADFHDARHLLALALRRLDRLSEARAELERMLSTTVRHDAAASDLACILYDMGSYTAALEPLRQAAVLQPESLEVWTRFADCAVKLGRHRDARDGWLALRGLAPHSAEILVNLGRAYAAIGESERAIESFSSAIKLDPGSANAYFNAGDLLYSLGAYPQAAETLCAALERDPANATGFFVLGNCYFQSGDFEAAALAYRAAVERRPGYREALHNLGLAESALSESRPAA